MPSDLYKCHPGRLRVYYNTHRNILQISTHPYVVRFNVLFMSKNFGLLFYMDINNNRK